MPLAEPMVATAVLPLLHEPPGVVLCRVEIEPAQIPVMPVMEAGVLFTVIGFIT